MISKRKLLQWRKEALRQQNEMKQLSEDCEMPVINSSQDKYIEMVLELTQELIDQHLLKEKS